MAGYPRLLGYYLIAAVLLMTGAGFSGSSASAVQVPQAKVVSDNPADWTPDILDGRVLSIVQLGSRIVVGGTFTQVQEKGANKPVLNRSGIFSFDESTGVIDPAFAPTIDSDVKVVLPAEDEQSVYIGGAFKTVNGTAIRGVARLSVPSGQLVQSFVPAPLDARVSDLRLVRGQLVLSGSFTKAAGVARTGLASLNPETGALTDFVNFTITDPRQGTMGVSKIDATPSGDRLVAIGNFAKVNGSDRPQLAVFDTSGDVAVLANWQSPFYAVNQCSSSFWTYMRDLDIDPTGKYVVITTTGAYGGSEGPCDVEARFELDQEGAGIKPTWRAYTGGDTTYAVAVTGTVVYVGGHMRWMNNPFAGDAEGPGAVDRPGIAALDPRNGIPLSWNPGRNPRGVGVFDMLATDKGLWIGSDTDKVAGETHRKLAFFPLDGGRQLPEENLGALPNDVYLLGLPAGTADPSVLYRVNAGGPALGSADDGPDWQAGNTGAYVNTGNDATWGAVPVIDASVPDSDDDRAPRALFDSERWDSGGAPEMSWSFPVPAGRNLEVRLFLANRYSGTSSVGQRVFDVTIDGNLVLDDLDMVAAYGNDTGHMERFDITSDGSVDISFGHVVENPLINGIEIIDRDLVGTGNTAAGDIVRRQYFTGNGPVSNASQSDGSDNWSASRGATLIDSALYVGKSNGSFTRRSFNGQTFGEPRVIDLNGGSFASDVSSVTGLFYDKADARLYYTLKGSNQLFWRGFLPESDIVGAARFTAGGSIQQLDPARVSGMFLSGGTLYFADADSGDLYSMDFADGSVSGPPLLVDSSIDWRARGAFVWNGQPAPGPNTPPTADFTDTCVGLACDFDASGSQDSDGLVTSYNWDFGDGSTASGKKVSHSFHDSGTFEVALTVTDDRGAQSTVRNDITVVRPPNADPVADIQGSCTYLRCTFDASGSKDADGSITAYEWDFADGTVVTTDKPEVEHLYADAGSYLVSVKVTDDQGGQDVADMSVTAEEPPAATVEFRSAATDSGNSLSGNVTVPPVVQEDDVLLLFASNNIGEPALATPGGWTLVDQVTDGSLRTALYSRVAGPNDSGSSVRVEYARRTKIDLTLLAYSGVDPSDPIASWAAAVEPGVTATHATPQLQSLPESGVVVSYWVDKTSGTTDWTVLGAPVVRSENYGSGSGRVTSIAADSPLAGLGSWPGAQAVADSEAGKATMWSIALR